LLIGVGYIYVCPGMVGCFFGVEGSGIDIDVRSILFPKSAPSQDIVSPELWPPPSILPSVSHRITSYHIQSRATTISPAKHNDQETIFSHLSVEKRKDVAPHKCGRKRPQEIVEEREKKKERHGKKVIEFLFLPNKLNNPTSLLDLLLRTRGNISRLNDKGDLRETAFAKDLRVSQRK